MSVPAWKRKISKTEYLYQTYQLEKEIVQLIYNTPSKYRHSFGDTLIMDCDKALLHGRTANDIWVTDKQSLNYRQYELSQMKSAIDNICTHTYVSLVCWVAYAKNYNSNAQVCRVIEHFEDSFGIPAKKLLRRRNKGWITESRSRIS